MHCGCRQNWGGAPTTQRLRFATPDTNVALVERYHRLLSELDPTLDLPTAEGEASDPQSADQAYDVTTKWLIDLVAWIIPKDVLSLVFSTLWVVQMDLVAWIIPKNILSLVFSTLGVVQMPHKFTAARRHKFDKVQYRVITWAEYNESLRQRGDLTIWVSEEAQSVWSAPRRTSRGGQRRYSDLAIETCLMLRTAYHLGLRQTQGLMGSIGTLMGLDIRVPDYSTLSRRANGVSIAQVMRQAGSVPIHLLVDSTGLKIFGEGEWLAQKHNTKGIRRRRRKLHLGLDLASGAIVCVALTHDNVGDSTALPSLLDQLDARSRAFWLTAPTMERPHEIC